MKRKLSKTPSKKDEMRSEYDFRTAVRGKFYKPLHKGYSVEIHPAHGKTVVKHFKLEAGAIMLQPDVQRYFPDSDAVNNALRSLLELMSRMPTTLGKKTPRRGLTHRAKNKANAGQSKLTSM